MKTLLLSTAVAIAITAPAQAADMPVKAPPAVAAVVQSWTGFYVGGHGGYGWGRNRVGYTPNDAASTALFNAFVPLGLAGLNASNRFSTRGVLGGVQVGYNRQISPRWVAGIEADFSFSTVDGSENRNGTVAAFATNFRAEENWKQFSTVRGRLGVLATENLLAFVTGGLALARIEHAASLNTVIAAGGFQAGGGVLPGFSCVPANPQCFVGATTRWQAGWTAGGGLEYKWTPNLSLKAEYLYASLRSSSVTATATAPSLGGGPLSTYTANFGRTNLNVVRAGLNLHFPAAN
jgi:outer membrane immunogenic protein